MNYSIGPCTCEWHGEQLHNIWICPEHGRIEHQPTRAVRKGDDAMVKLTKEDWVEIYYALVDKQAKIDKGTYTSDDEVLSEDIPTWSKHMGEIIDKIGPDGENMI